MSTVSSQSAVYCRSPRRRITGMPPDVVTRKQWSAHARRDAQMKAHIQQVWEDNFGVYGARKVWRQLLRDGVRVARCTIERLMKAIGLQGVRRGRVIRTTRRDESAPFPLDRVKRLFRVQRPDALWVADFTYVWAWTGFSLCTWLSSPTYSPGASLADVYQRQCRRTLCLTR